MRGSAVVFRNKSSSGFFAFESCAAGAWAGEAAGGGIGCCGVFVAVSADLAVCASSSVLKSAFNTLPVRGGHLKLCTF